MGKYDALIPGRAPATTSPKKAGKYAHLVPEPTPEKPLKGGVIGGIREVIQDVTAVVKAPFPKRSANPKVALDTAAQGVADVLDDTFERYKKSYHTYQNPNASLKEKAIAQGELTMGLINTAFAPITATLQGAAKLPVVGPVAEVVNRFFGALGTVGSDLAEGAVDTLPVSEQTKEQIRPLAMEVGALVAQIGAGKAGLDKVTLLRERSKNLAEVIDRDLTHQVKIISEGETVRVPVKTPNTKHAAYAKKMGYEPYTPIEELPIIRMGPRPTSNVPTIQIEPRKVKGEFTYEPIEEVPAQPPRPVATVPEASVPVGTTPKPAQPVQRPITKPAPLEGADQVINSRAQTLEKAAVEKKLTDSLGELPTHNRMDMADQASRALEFIEKDPQRAMRVVRGESVPDGILPESVYTALEIKAIKEGNVEMLKELSNSTIPTTAGQAMKALDSTDPNSPVKIMRDIQQFREAKVEQKTGKKRPQAIKEVVKEIREEVQKSVSKRPTWEDFMREITCK